MTMPRPIGKTVLLLAAVGLAAGRASSAAPPPAGTSASGTGLDGTAQQAGRQQPAPSERWALVAGVGKYDDHYIHPLHGDDDARAFAGALRDRAGFPSDHIVLLAGQDAEDCHLASLGAAREKTAASDSPSRACRADLRNLLRNLSQITSLVPPNGLFVFYFSGHGKYVDGESVLFPSDLEYQDENYAKHQGLRANEIAADLRKSHIKQVLIFLDACRNQFLTTRGPQDERTSPEFAKGFDLNQLNLNVEVFLTFFSSSAGSASYEDSAEKRSYFTSELVRALNGEGDAYDAHNLLTLGGLIHYVQPRVKSRVQAERGASQIPDPYLSGFLADELVLARRERP